MDWAQIFVNLILTGILLYVFQRVIDERSAKRLESFKTELRSITFESETKFSKLHEKRAEVINEIYRRLVDAIHVLVELKNTVERPKPKSKEIKDIVAKMDEVVLGLMDYYNKNQLYLPENLYVKVSALTLNFVTVKQKLLSIHDDTDMLIDNKSQDNDNWGDLAEFSTDMVEKIGPLFKEIEEDFRRILGSQ